MLYYIYIFIFLLILLMLFFLVYILLLDIELIKVLPPILPVFLLVALFTLLERKLLAGFQRRRGPNIVGIFGLMQPFADALKLISKETIVPGLSNIILFILAPILTFTISLLNWSIVPFSFNVILSDINLSILFLLSISSLGVYGIIISGWSSNSKYAFLGSLRSAAQFISYEVSIGLIIMVVLLCVGSLNFNDIIMFQCDMWFILPLFPTFIMFFISTLAETNRIPFDLPEAESELVSGYNVEYSSTTFVLFFLAEYSNIIIMSIFIAIFFFGGWLPIFNLFFFYYFPLWIWLFFKVIIIIILFILVRGTLPRYRYDQLMNIGWKVLLPFSLSYLFFYSTLFWII